MERSAGNVVLPASMVKSIFNPPLPPIIFDRFCLFCFVLFFQFKVTAIVMRLMDVVLASPVIWEFDAKSLALKVFTHFLGYQSILK